MHTKRVLTRISSMLVAFLMALVSLGIGTAPAMAAVNLTDFMKKYGDDLYSACKAWNVPELAVLAQSLQEQGLSTNSIDKSKWNLWNYQALPKDIEKLPGFAGALGVYSNGSTKGVYAAWDTVGQDAYGYGYFLTHNSNYKPAFNNVKDPAAFIQGLKNAGYAEDPGYVSHVTRFFGQVQSATDAAGKKLFLPTKNGAGDGKGFVSGAGGDPSSDKAPTGQNAKDAASRMTDEGNLVGMMSPKKLQTNNLPDAPDYSQLSLGDKANIQALKDNQAAEHSLDFSQGWGTVIMAIGFIILAYAFFLFLALIFDKANTIFEFSAVSFLTFGHIKRTYDENGTGLDHKFVKDTAVHIAIAVLIAALLLGGAVQDILTWIAGWTIR